DETDEFSFNNSEDIEPEIENNIIDKITDNIKVDEIEETNRQEISYSKERNNETNEIDEIDEANNFY
ncbi:12891_t:CDS:2, partial [Racocetra fulgida]